MYPSIQQAVNLTIGQSIY